MKTLNVAESANSRYRQKKQRRRLKGFHAYWPIYLMALPGLIYFLINNYLPMVGVFIAFKDVNYTKGIFGSDWIGFKNFEYLFSSNAAVLITKNTILYNLGFIVTNLIVPIALAIMISKVVNRVARGLYQTVVLVPYLISMVIVGYLGFALLSSDSGFINKTLCPAFGLSPVPWYNTPDAWPFILNIVNIWKNAGYYCVIYLAAIMGIDPSYYEAAKIDGAGALTQIFKITIPSIMPVMLTMVLLQVGRIFYSDFGLFYQVPMDSGAVMRTTNVIDTYVYRGLMKLGDIGMASAAGVYQSIVGFAVIYLANRVVRHISPENAIF